MLNVSVDGAVSFLNFLAVKVKFGLQYQNGKLAFDGVGRIEFTPKLFLEGWFFVVYFFSL